jgi:hypothetical protein
MGKEVAQDEDLYRGIITKGVSSQIKKDGRISSYAFYDARGELSVDIASKTTSKESLNRLIKSDALVMIQAKIPFTLGYKVEEDPIFNVPGLSDNPAHALILSGGVAISQSHRRIMAQHCSWAIPPTDIST